MLFLPGVKCGVRIESPEYKEKMTQHVMPKRLLKLQQHSERSEGYETLTSGDSDFVSEVSSRNSELL